MEILNIGVLCSPLISTLVMQRKNNSLLVKGQPGLHGMFQAICSYVVRSYLKKKQKEIENIHQQHPLDSAEACYQQVTITTPSACWHYISGAVLVQQKLTLSPYLKFRWVST